MFARPSSRGGASTRAQTGGARTRAQPTRHARTPTADAGSRDEFAQTLTRAQLAAQAPVPSSSPSAAESALVQTIAQKQAALEASKAELERSLAATRALEAKFDDERRRLQTQQASIQREGVEREPQPFWGAWSATSDATTRAPIGHAAQTPVTAYSHSQPWRRATADALLSATPRSHPTENALRLSRDRESPAAGLTPNARGKQRDFPAGRSARHSTHPNHPPSFAPPEATDEIDTRDLLRALPASKKTVLDLFRNYDVNATGAVNSNEFATGLMQAGLDLSIPQVTSIIAKLDRENRGEIRYINLIDSFRADDPSTANGGGGEELPARLFEPAAAPQSPAVYVPIPPYDSLDPAVAEARRTRNRQSSALAILRTSDRAMLQPDGTFASASSQMPEHFTTLTGEKVPSSLNYFPRPVGFVERPFSHSLGPSNIIENPLVHQHELRHSNSTGWGGDRDGPADPRPLVGEFGRDYHASVLDPASSVGACLRSISERVAHEPARFAAMMRKMDRDGDQQVTHKEFMSGLEQLGLNVPTWRMRNLIQAVDRHGTGGVRYEQVSGLLAHYADAGRREQQELIDARAAAASETQVNPLKAPGFRPSHTIPLHSQPTWSASNGLGNNVEAFTHARQVEREWAARAEREKAERVVREEEQRRVEAEQRASKPDPRDAPLFEAWTEPEPAQYHENAAYPARTRDEPTRRAEYSESPPVDSYAATPRDEYASSPDYPIESPTPPPHAVAPSPAPVAHYPYMNRTSEEKARLEELQRRDASSPAAIPTYEYAVPESQTGTELPVLEVEYPQLRSNARSRTPAPRRTRSRSNSVSSVRSVRSQTPSLRSVGGGGSRAASRRGSFSQAPRASDAAVGGGSGAFFGGSARFEQALAQPPTPRGGRLHDSNAASYWGDDRESVSGASARGRSRSRGGDETPRRSASVSGLGAETSRVRVEEFGSSVDGELFKILKLALAPPLSTKARAALSRPTTPGVDQMREHARYDAYDVDSSPPTPTSGDSRASSSAASIHRHAQIGVGIESRSRAPHSYSLSTGVWSDRRARDFYGSGFTLG